MGNWLRDLAYAARSLARAPGFTLAAGLTMAVAIGANTAVFSVVKAVLLEPLPYDTADRLMAIGSAAPGANVPGEFGLSEEFYLQYRDNAKAIEELALYDVVERNFRLDGGTEWLSVAWVTPSLFSTLGASPRVGRIPPVEEITPGVTLGILSHSSWQRFFGGDRGVIGRTVRLSGQPAIVTGVMGPEFRFPDDQTALWVLHVVDPDEVEIGAFTWNAIARAAPGTSPEQLQRQLVPLVGQLLELYPGDTRYGRFLREGRYRPVVHGLKEATVGDLQEPLWILLGTVALVLLIACANVANLFVVRAESRSRLTALRGALGATRFRLVTTHLAEALVLALGGGAAGVFLAWLGVPALLSMAPADIPRLDQVRFDVPVLGFTAGVVVLAALLFGLGPGLRYSSAATLARLGVGGRDSSVGPKRRWVQNALVAGQSALAFVLLVGFGLLVRSFQELRSIDPGFEAQNVLTFKVSVGDETYPDAASSWRFHGALLDRLARLPGVESVGAVGDLPLTGEVDGGGIEVEETGADDLPSIVRYTFAAPGYFETLGIDLVAGRTFVRADQETDLGHAVVSRSLAEALWPGEDALGKRLRRAGANATGWETVVGVVEDVRAESLREPADPMLYLPVVPRPESHGWVVRSPTYTVRASNPGALVSLVRDAVHSVDPGVPVYAVQTLESVVAGSMVRLSFTMVALSVAAGVALLLAAVGLYGVLSYVVSQRRHEIGVRLALGARAGQVRKMVVAQGLRLALLGLSGGLVIALSLSRVLERLVFGIRTFDTPTWTATFGVLLIVALLASYLPARRASAADPAEAMRPE